MKRRTEVALYRRASEAGVLRVREPRCPALAVARKSEAKRVSILLPGPKYLEALELLAREWSK